MSRLTVSNKSSKEGIKVLPQEEYLVLRQTIRERGTARMVLVPLLFVGWAAIAVATTAWITLASGTLIPLLLLVAGFEAVFALHVSVERIGRYLQVFHEAQGGWEHIAMRFGQRFPGAGPDPLFTRLFLLATAINVLPAALAGLPIEVAVVAALHLGFVFRLRAAGSYAARQRAEDLDRFSQLRTDASAVEPPV